jgi:hypothetical protein
VSGPWRDAGARQEGALERGSAGYGEGRAEQGWQRESTIPKWTGAGGRLITFRERGGFRRRDRSGAHSLRPPPGGKRPNSGEERSPQKAPKRSAFAHLALLNSPYGQSADFPGAGSNGKRWFALFTCPEIGRHGATGVTIAS